MDVIIYAKKDSRCLEGKYIRKSRGEGIGI